MTDAVTKPLRAEHQDLLPRIEGLDALAIAVGRGEAGAVDRLREELHALAEHLVPHAFAEEAVLYPAVEKAMGAAGATETMIADHGEILRRIDQLEAMGEAGVPDPEEARTVLHGLAAILLLHFRKEEDVLLPVLDATLDEREAAALFTHMSHVAHGG
jgi:iron-sulfur cluster repair protein YtfE (RIC family)